MTELKRRDLLQLLGCGAAALGAGLRLFAESPPGSDPEHAWPGDAPEPAPAPAPWELLAPLTEGAMLGGATLTRLSPINETGNVDLEFNRGVGVPLRIRLCRRDDDPNAPVPPARTARYDLFLANGGKGDLPTAAADGRLVLELAEVVRQNELAQPPVPVGTLRERWARLA